MRLFILILTQNVIILRFFCVIYKRKNKIKFLNNCKTKTVKKPQGRHQITNK